MRRFVYCLVGVLASSPALAQSAKQRGEKAEASEPVRVDSSDRAQLRQSEELNLSVGENKTISAAQVRSFSEGAKGIADVRLTPDSSQFVIVGQRPFKRIVCEQLELFVDVRDSVSQAQNREIQIIDLLEFFVRHDLVAPVELCFDHVLCGIEFE